MSRPSSSGPRMGFPNARVSKGSRQRLRGLRTPPLTTVWVSQSHPMRTAFEHSNKGQSLASPGPFPLEAPIVPCSPCQGAIIGLARRAARAGRAPLLSTLDLDERCPSPNLPPRCMRLPARRTVVRQATSCGLAVGVRWPQVAWLARAVSLRVERGSWLTSFQVKLVARHVKQKTRTTGGGCPDDHAAA